MTEKAEKYLMRIGLDPAECTVPDAALLKKLQYAHVSHVPYENLDIVNGIPLRLDSDSLYEKIVEKRRGGYCFEVNGAFKWLLNELGYKTTQHLARFLRGEAVPPKGRHRVIIAFADGKRYLCDAGVGSTAPRYPLLLEDGIEQEQFGEKYTVKHDERLGTVVSEYINGAYSDYISFGDENLFDRDFETPSFYCEKHPSSPFGKLMLSLKTSDGRITVDGNIFRIRQGEKITAEKLLGDDEIKYYAEKYFKLKY